MVYAWAFGLLAKGEIDVISSFFASPCKRLEEFSDGDPEG